MKRRSGNATRRRRPLERSLRADPRLCRSYGRTFTLSAAMGTQVQEESTPPHAGALAGSQQRSRAPEHSAPQSELFRSAARLLAVTGGARRLAGSWQLQHSLEEYISTPGWRVAAGMPCCRPGCAKARHAAAAAAPQDLQAAPMSHTNLPCCPAAAQEGGAPGAPAAAAPAAVSSGSEGPSCLCFLACWLQP